MVTICDHKRSDLEIFKFWFRAKTCNVQMSLFIYCFHIFSWFYISVEMSTISDVEVDKVIQALDAKELTLESSKTHRCAVDIALTIQE